MILILLEVGEVSQTTAQVGLTVSSIVLPDSGPVTHNQSHRTTRAIIKNDATFLGRLHLVRSVLDR